MVAAMAVTTAVAAPAATADCLEESFGSWGLEKRILFLKFGRKSDATMAMGEKKKKTRAMTFFHFFFFFLSRARKRGPSRFFCGWRRAFRFVLSFPVLEHGSGGTETHAERGC